jgi:hypothetical protein
MKKVLKMKPCEMLDRIESHFEKVCSLINEAVQEKKVQRLRELMLQLNVLLGRSESLRTQFICGGSYNLPYYIDDEIKYVKRMLKNWD